MELSGNLYNQINTLPWQALYEYALQKGITDNEVKNKDKAQLINLLRDRDLIITKEINQLIEEYIYGDRVTFSVWRFSEIDSAIKEKIMLLKGEQILVDNGEFRNIRIQNISELENRLELFFVYSKAYNYMNEDGKLDKVWEQHKGCCWIGLDKEYAAFIVKHEKMIKIFISFLEHRLTKTIFLVRPPLSSLKKIFNKSIMSKIVLQGLDGEKTAISRSDGFTDEQKIEVERVREKRYNSSGSYITPICNNINATVRYNLKKGNISILKHLSSKELFNWTEKAIEIIFEEIDNLKGKDVTSLFSENGQELKWPLLNSNEQDQMNWILNQLINNINQENNIFFPEDKRQILNDDNLFIKILRPYCEKCNSYEVPICKECGRNLSSKLTEKFCSCGSSIQAVCQEGHRLLLNKYFYIPTKKCISFINNNIKKIYPNFDSDYFMAILDDELVISFSENHNDVEVQFDEIEEFKISNFEITEELREFAKKLKEKCARSCSYDNIVKCLNNNQQICLPKLFYNIIPNFRPQPHKGEEFGDISGSITINGKQYKMIGIIKKNSSKKNQALLSTSSVSQEIIRQFIEQGMIDNRCDLIMVVIPQNIDNSFKGTLRFLASLAHKKIVFAELESVCKLLRKAKIM